MARYVVKLGSSIVAEDSGALRAEVLARVCDEVAARHGAGDDVVVVTSGAIARGIQIMDLPLRPTAVEDLQAASAVGQGKLYRVYDELLRERGITSAQVLLTFFDMSARTHYLNARQTLGRLLDWRVVPVINENDTTTTDDISFGDNDFLAAQVAILIAADLLVLLTDIDGLYTADPRSDPSARLVDEVTNFEGLNDIEIGHTTSPLGSGGMRSKVVAAEMPPAVAISAATTLERIPPDPSGEVAWPICSESSDAKSSTFSTSAAAGSTRGSPVNRPSVSVSRTSRSAPMSTATCAARKSLSPKEISSVVVVSFSLMTGTTPRSSRRRSVWRAFR